MRKSSWRVRFLSLLLFAFAAPVFASVEGVQAVDTAWSAAMKANDLEAVMRTYADDAVAWLPNDPEAKGSVAIRAIYAGLLGTFTVTDVVFSDTSYKTVGDTSVGWGKFSLTLAPKAGGAAVVMQGRFAAVAERREGRWVYTMDHASVEPPPAKSVEPAKTAAGSGN